MKSIEELTDSFDEFLFEELRDPEIATGYLRDAFENGTSEEILNAVNDVLKANNDSITKGMPLGDVMLSLGKYGIRLTTARHLPKALRKLSTARPIRSLPTARTSGSSRRVVPSRAME